MDSGTEKRIEETVLDILRSSNMDEVTESMIRKTASERLGLDLSDPTRKKFVRQVVNNYLDLQNVKDKDDVAPEKEEEEDEEEEEEDEEDDSDDKKKRKKEYDDDGDLIVCRLSKSRRVTITEFKGKTLVSMREYYNKGGKDLPTSKGISLTSEQWAAFSKNVPAIERALEKMKSRLD